jgi:SAM-dependent methyltransferase
MVNLYTEADAVSAYDLLDPVDDHADEAAAMHRLLRAAVAGPAETLLELGAGAGNNAKHLSAHWALTLSDVSPLMLARSAAQNPSAAHVVGDMRTLRLGRTFDAVLVHDAIVYMHTRADLRAALATAFTHLRVGGAALVLPDVLADTYEPGCELVEADDGERSLRGVIWSHAPRPAAETIDVDYGLLVRTGDTVKMVHDHHTEGLFSRAVWIATMRDVGFDVDVVDRGVDVEAGYSAEVFIGRRTR